MKKVLCILILAVILTGVLTLTVSAKGDLARVIDETDTLSTDEITALNRIVDSFRQKYNMDCVLLMIDSLGGVTARDYADDFYDEGGYGMGNDNSGVLFLISIYDRECYISTCGSAIAEINDYEIDLILDDATYYLADDDWYGGFRAFVSAAGRMLEHNYGKGGNGNGGGYNDPGYYYEPEDDTFERILIVFIAPAVIAGIAVAVMCWSMNNARGKSTAADYTVRGSFALTGALDILISRHVSRTAKDTGNHGGGGGGHGGSSHISHSGVSHGGGGRSF